MASEALIKARRDAGLCRCGVALEGGYKQCPICRYNGTQKMRNKVNAGICVRCGTEKAHRYLCDVCRKIESDLGASRRRRQKQAVVALYGGHCICCGETTLEFLTMDHRNRDGAIERRSTGIDGGPRFYRRLLKLGVPRIDLQLLCANCNLGRELNGGVCPHQAKKQYAEAR